MAKIKLIIDTDPGIDDAMAILAAFNSPEVEIIGLTTIFGNVPVAEGSCDQLNGLTKTRVADFVHGAEGFGNTYQQLVEGKKHSLTAAQFIANAASEHPGEVVVLALGPVTNIALAYKVDPQLRTRLKEVVILGGAFQSNGNVNPAAEANILGDPDAADYVMEQGNNVRLVSLDVTHQVEFTSKDMDALHGRGRFGSFISDISKFYIEYYRKSYGVDSCFVHDPTAFAAVFRPDLFTWQAGKVLVLTEGVARGMTIMDHCVRNWAAPHAWSDRPLVQVAVAVQADKVAPMLLERLAM
ncbi:hypothetical protein WJX84_001186 [Apatococcus fuscideae]|uniref:Inosine/uridine-preferring nucleoside hydrolase domain-containing protein n=1 Tax=Apatococcus fuscideae TaxID=2026836 RepID=A0AAW1SMG3_9CHLO